MDKVRYKNTLKIILLSVVSTVVFLPLYLVFINSLKSNAESALLNLSLPSKLLVSNYPQVIKEGQIFRAMINGMVISSGTVVICTLAASMAAFVIIRRRNKMNAFLYNLFIAGLMAPLTIVPAIRVLQWLHTMKFIRRDYIRFGRSKYSI